MDRIIHSGQWHENKTYTRRFDWASDPGSGFAFPCDADGIIKCDEMQPAGLANLARCLDGAYDVVDRGVQCLAWSWYEPPLIRCECGESVSLGDFTNPCPGCQADYDASGNRLAPRHLWGEETGEHWTECV